MNIANSTSSQENCLSPNLQKNQKLKKLKKNMNSSIIRKSTATSDLTDENLSTQENYSITKIDNRVKSSIRSCVSSKITIILIENIKKDIKKKVLKANKSSTPMLKLYIGLKNEKTNTIEYFKLYKDNEIGFEKCYQECTQNLVIDISIQTMDDDCQTDNEQIEAAKNNLEDFLICAAKCTQSAKNGTKYQNKKICKRNNKKELKERR